MVTYKLSGSLSHANIVFMLAIPFVLHASNGSGDDGISSGPTCAPFAERTLRYFSGQGAILKQSTHLFEF